MSNVLHDALFAPHRGSARMFLIDEGGDVISYDDFLRHASRLANALTSSGLKSGDRVAVQVAKSPGALALYAAAVQSGVVFLPLNTAYTASEVDYFVGDAEPGLVVCDEASEAALKLIAERHGTRLLTLNADGSGSLAALAKAQSDDAPVASRTGSDLAALLYTSGTTGRSKGAMLTHGNLLSNAAALVDAWRFTADDVLLHALPIFHTHGLFVASNVMARAGGSMIFLPAFDVDQVVRLLPQATTMMGVPTFYTRLLGDPRLTRDLVRHMRLFVSGSAPLLAQTHADFEARTGHRILERYGMTETNMNTSNPYDGERRAGTVGLPLPGVDLRIADPATGAALPRGETGVIEVRGPNVFKGYWRNPEKTREEFRPDGFFITGDLGVEDPDGYVRIVGRAKDLIISGGYNIYPKELELLIDEQDGVLESAVIGVPHPDFGEAVVAIVVPRPGARLDADMVMAALRDKLARFKQPKRVFVADDLPRNTMGKVQKNVLRERYASTFAAAWQ